MLLNEYDITKQMIRTISEGKQNEGVVSIPVTDDPKFGNQTLTNMKNEAAKTIGADFTGMNTPLLFYPKDTDLVFSGTIPDLSGLKFQFRSKDSTGKGCYIWVENLQLTPENVKKLAKIQGYYENWKEYIIKNPMF